MLMSIPERYMNPETNLERQPWLFLEHQANPLYPLQIG
jgi:hypothetical protein